MGLIHSRFGLAWIVIFFSFLIALTYYLLLRMSVRGGKNSILGLLIVTLVMVSSHIDWLARPHAFSFVLTVIWYQILDEYQTDQRNRLFWLPAVMLLWVNLHGGVLLGFILLGVYFACNVAASIFCSGDSGQEAKRKARSLGCVLLVCLAAS